MRRTRNSDAVDAIVRDSAIARIDAMHLGRVVRIWKSSERLGFFAMLADRVLFLRLLPSGWSVASVPESGIG